MEQQDPRISEAQEMAARVGEDQQAAVPETNHEKPGTLGSLEDLRALLRRAWSGQKPAPGRRELGRDKTKSLFALAGAGVALLCFFFGVFSSPRTRPPLPGETARVGPSLGLKSTPGSEQNDGPKAVPPLLNADVRSGNGGPGSQVTPEEVGGTSPRFSELSKTPVARTTASQKPSPGRAKDAGEYALKNVDFSDPAVAQPARTNPPSLPATESDSDLKKPSMVFVRSAQNASPALENPPPENNTLAELLPAGTRLVARLEAPVSSATPAPVIAVVEYNYEHNGEIVLPAGARVIGKLSHASPSGFVGFQFDRIEMPDGAIEKIDAIAMDLKFGPLKGDISGRRRGANFLVRTMTGLGTVAAYVVGGQGMTGINGPISENSLLRERLADNVGMAGQDEINMLAANQNIVVTVPGGIRFYIVVEKDSSDRQARRSLARSTDTNNTSLANTRVPTLEELRELMQLKSELAQMYLQSSAQPAPPEQ
jgi:hypothetical protein